MKKSGNHLEPAPTSVGLMLETTQVPSSEASMHGAWTAKQIHARYILATRATGEGVWDWDQASAKTYYSAQWQNILGLPQEDLTSGPEHFCSLLHPADRERFLAFCKGSDDVDGGQFEGEYRMLHADGSWRWIQIRGIRVHDKVTRGPRRVRVVGTISDVTRHRALDPLTGLNNRFSLIDRLDRRLKTQDPRPFAVLFLDVDSFKRINDSFSHWHGDSVLLEVARRIQSTLASDPSSIAARIGGDEFVVMLDYMEEEDVATYSNALQALLQLPIWCGAQQLYLTSSVGAAMSTTGYLNAEDMLQDADMAMYRAKAKGKAKSCFFTRSIREEIRQHMQVEVELRRALDENELVLHYQPKVLLSTGAITGFESLVRWNHPTRGLVGPGEFIPTAEDSDLILRIGRWTMVEAIRQTSAWVRNGIMPAHMTMAVNLSARQFSDFGLVKAVAATLAAEGLPPRNFEIEVTESALIEDTNLALATLRELKALGIGLDLDDFGMGYSSLSYLHRLPFDTLKVDRSFVVGLGEDDESSAIARSIIALGAALKMKVLAEGIETADQCSRVQALGCLYGQGYYFSKPLAAAECVRLIANNAQARNELGTSKLRSRDLPVRKMAYQPPPFPPTSAFRVPL